MVLALGAAHSGQAAKAQREVTDMTNELLKKNAAALKMAAIETAKEVLRIRTEGLQKRKEAEVELNRIENELKQKLLNMNNK